MISHDHKCFLLLTITSPKSKPKVEVRCHCDVIKNEVMSSCQDHLLNCSGSLGRAVDKTSQWMQCSGCTHFTSVLYSNMSEPMFRALQTRLRVIDCTLHHSWIKQYDHTARTRNCSGLPAATAKHQLPRLARLRSA